MWPFSPTAHTVTGETRLTSVTEQGPLLPHESTAALAQEPKQKTLLRCKCNQGHVQCNSFVPASRFYHVHSLIFLSAFLCHPPSCSFSICSPCAHKRKENRKHLKAIVTCGIVILRNLAQGALTPIVGRKRKGWMPRDRKKLFMQKIFLRKCVI